MLLVRLLRDSLTEPSDSVNGDDRCQAESIASRSLLDYNKSNCWAGYHLSLLRRQAASVILVVSDDFAQELGWPEHGSRGRNRLTTSSPLALMGPANPLIYVGLWRSWERA